MATARTMRAATRATVAVVVVQSRVTAAVQMVARVAPVVQASVGPATRDRAVVDAEAVPAPAAAKAATPTVRMPIHAVGLEATAPGGLAGSAVVAAHKVGTAPVCPCSMLWAWGGAHGLTAAVIVVAVAVAVVVVGVVVVEANGTRHPGLHRHSLGHSLRPASRVCMCKQCGKRLGVGSAPARHSYLLWFYVACLRTKR